MNNAIKLQIDSLKAYLEKNNEIIFAYLFGSYARGSGRANSDIDVAVYLKDHEGLVAEK